MGKKQGFFIPTEPLKSLGKKGKTLAKTRNSSQGTKNKEFQKNKERKDWLGLFQEMGIRGPVWGRGNPNTEQVAAEVEVPS